MLHFFLGIWRKNILFRLYGVIFLAVFFSTGVYIAYSVETLRAEAEKDMQERLDQLTSVLTESLARPLFDINNVLVSSVVAALGTTPDLVMLRVLDSDGGQLAVSGKRSHATSALVSTRRAIQYRDGARIIPVGTIELTLSRDAIDQDLRSKILHTVITNLLMTLAIIVSIYLVARKIARPFADIQDALEKLERGETNIQLSGIRREDQIGRLSNAVRSFRDTITKLKEAERTTAAHLTEKSVALDKLHAVFEGSNDAVMLLTDKGYFDCNHQTLEMFGIKNKQEFIRCHPSDLSPLLQPDGRNSCAAANEKIDLAFAQGRARFEWLHCHKNGQEFPTEVILSAFNYGDEKVLQATVRDITERKKIERELIQLNEDLETRIAARTRELTLAMQLAEAASIAKGEFLANMSHEIRTPMNAIIGMAYLALRTNLQPKQHDYVDKIHLAAQSLLGILNDILDFSKIEAGKLDMEEVTFSLDDVLANVTSVTIEKAADKRLEYLLHVPHTVPRQLVGDPLRLGQILINLVNNAIKFTDCGEIELSCAVQDKRDGKVHLHFSVRDTGIGMTPEQCAKLFQSFSQADSSITRKYGGTGLGLSISQQLVELMGGRISVNSQAGAGSEFQFNLTLALAVQPDAMTVLPAALNQARILVVDDNPVARAILIESLKTMPLRVDDVDGGEDALQAIMAADAAQDPYSLVLTDWRMPQMDGIELTRRVKTDTRLKTPPYMVLVTAFGREEVRKEAEEAGIDGFLLKPVNQSTLVNTLVAVFSAPTRVAEPAIISQQQFTGIRVLLAEDNDINQQIAVELLEHVGIRADIANNGREAIDKLLAAGPAGYGLVLMDLQMPVMDGHAAAIAIRQNPDFDKLPIIAMTAHALAEVRNRCLEEGMQDHLTKPINPEHFYATLARYLGTAMKPMPAPSTDANADALPMLAGIDTTSGLSHVSHNHALYFQLLNRFRDSQRKVIEALREEYDAGLWAEAERRVHTLRGVAGNIGAIKLQHAAEKLELFLTASKISAPADPLFAQHLHKVEAALATVLDGLDQHFSHSANALPPPAALTPLPATQEVLLELLVMLKECDGDTPDYFDSVRTFLGLSIEEATLQQLASHISQYEFEEAHQMLALLHQSI